MRSLNGMTFSGRGERQQLEPAARVYSRSPIGVRSRTPETQSIFKHPVVSILLRIDEIKSREVKSRDFAGNGVRPQADRTLAELEACLAAIQRDAI